MNFNLLDYRYNTEKKQMFFLPSKNFSLMNKKLKPKKSNNDTSYSPLSDKPQSNPQPQDMIQPRNNPQIPSNSNVIEPCNNPQIPSNSNVIGPRNNQVRVPLRGSVENIAEEEKSQGGGLLDSSPDQDRINL
tara:strand:- start:81 stop:476 length:396 start_codon:yes stop_codon:yes gene_type:complete